MRKYIFLLLLFNGIVAEAQNETRTISIFNPDNGQTYSMKANAEKRGITEKEESALHHSCCYMKEYSEVYSDSRTMVEFRITTDFETKTRTGELYLTIKNKWKADSEYVLDERLLNILNKALKDVVEESNNMSSTMKQEGVKTCLVKPITKDLVIRATYGMNFFRNSNVWKYYFSNGSASSKALDEVKISELSNKLNQAYDEFKQNVNRNYFKE